MPTNPQHLDEELHHYAIEESIIAHHDHDDHDDHDDNSDTKEDLQTAYLNEAIKTTIDKVVGVFALLIGIDLFHILDVKTGNSFALFVFLTLVLFGLKVFSYILHKYQCADYLHLKNMWKFFQEVTETVWDVAMVLQIRCITILIKGWLDSLFDQSDIFAFGIILIPVIFIRLVPYVVNYGRVLSPTTPTQRARPVRPSTAGNLRVTPHHQKAVDTFNSPVYSPMQLISRPYEGSIVVDSSSPPSSVVSIHHRTKPLQRNTTTTTTLVQHQHQIIPEDLKL